MLPVFVHIQHIQGIIGCQRIRIAFLIQPSELIYEDHHLRRRVRIFAYMLIQILRIRHLLKMRILHIEKRQIGDRIALILGRLIAQIGFGMRCGSLLQVFGTEGKAFGFTCLPCMFLIVAVKYLDFFDIQLIELLVLFSRACEHRQTMTGKDNAQDEYGRYDA